MKDSSGLTILNWVIQENLSADAVVVYSAIYEATFKGSIATSLEGLKKYFNNLSKNELESALKELVKKGFIKKIPFTFDAEPIYGYVINEEEIKNDCR